PAEGHVVHRPAGGHQEAAVTLDELLGEEEVVRLETLVGGGETVPLVEDEQLVEKRGAGAPVADDEKGRLRDLRASNPAAVDGLLQPAQKRVEDADDHIDDGDVPETRLDGEAIPGQEAEQREEIAAEPDTRHPFAFGSRGGCGSLWLRRR